MPADSFESPLTLAACGGHVELAMLLLERGANIEEVRGLYIWYRYSVPVQIQIFDTGIFFYRYRYCRYWYLPHRFEV